MKCRSGAVSKHAIGNLPRHVLPVGVVARCRVGPVFGICEQLPVPVFGGAHWVPVVVASAP